MFYAVPQHIKVNVFHFLDDNSLVAFMQSTRLHKNSVVDGTRLMEGAALLVFIHGGPSLERDRGPSLEQGGEDDSDVMGICSSGDDAETVGQPDEEEPKVKFYNAMQSCHTIKSYHAMQWLAGEELGRALRAMRRSYSGLGIVSWQPLCRPLNEKQSSFGVYATFKFHPSDVRKALGETQRSNLDDDYVYSNEVDLKIKLADSEAVCCVEHVLAEIICVDDDWATYPSIRVYVKPGAVSPDQRSYTLSVRAILVDFPDRELHSEHVSTDGGKFWQSSWLSGRDNAGLAMEEDKGGLTHALLNGDGISSVIRIDCSSQAAVS
jgi:hypothetical protein